MATYFKPDDNPSQDDLSSLSVVSGNREKIEDIKLATGLTSLPWVRFEPREEQENKQLLALRLKGEEFYSEVAQRSALQKFRLMQETLGQGVQPGYTVVDSTLWAPWFNGLPGLNAANYFASYTEADGNVIRSEAVLDHFCKASADAKNRRVVWIETAVTAVLDENGETAPRVRQKFDICFTSIVPYHKGSTMWPITCPNPKIVATALGRMDHLRELEQIEDVNWELPARANELGLLMSYAELVDKKIIDRKNLITRCPRGELFRNWDSPGVVREC